MYARSITQRAEGRKPYDPSPFLLIVILNLLFVLSIVFNATHQGVPNLDSGIASGL